MIVKCFFYLGCGLKKKGALGNNCMRCTFGKKIGLQESTRTSPAAQATSLLVKECCTPCEGCSPDILLLNFRTDVLVSFLRSKNMPHVCGSFLKESRRAAAWRWIQAKDAETPGKIPVQLLFLSFARFQVSVGTFLLCLTFAFTCFPESTFVSRLVVVGCSSEVFSWNKLRATHGLPFRAPVYRGCPSRKKPVCLRVQGDPEAKSQTVVVLS